MLSAMSNIWHDSVVDNQYCKGIMESRIGGRFENQDYFGCSITPIGFLLVVCDGMGGGPGGATASSEATREIINIVKKANPDDLDKKKVLVDAIQKANQHLRNLQSQNSQLLGMGTTCVVLLFDENQAIAAHAGDSRIYQMRFGKKLWRTFDHSLVMEKTKTEPDFTEEDARQDSNSNVITRALGICDDIEVDTKELSYEKGDRFVLCTDGVWGVMPEHQLIKLLNSSKDIGGTAEKTMIAVQESGIDYNKNKLDNFTLVLVETKCNSNLKEEMTHKTRSILRVLSFVCFISLILNITLFMSHCHEPNNKIPSSNKWSDSVNSTPNFNIDSIDNDRVNVESIDLEDSINALWDTITTLRQRNREIKQSIKGN